MESLLKCVRQASGEVDFFALQIQHSLFDGVSQKKQNCHTGPGEVMQRNFK